MNSIHEECGVFGIFANRTTHVAHSVYYALYALQHRGQESCGIVVNDDGLFNSYRDSGLVNDVFSKDVLAKLGRKPHKGQDGDRPQRQPRQLLRAQDGARARRLDLPDDLRHGSYRLQHHQGEDQIRLLQGVLSVFAPQPLHRFVRQHQNPHRGGPPSTVRPHFTWRSRKCCSHPPSPDCRSPGSAPGPGRREPAGPRREGPR